jgi:hypothetical protein
MFSLLDRLLGLPMKEVLDDDPAAANRQWCARC